MASTPREGMPAGNEHEKAAPVPEGSAEAVSPEDEPAPSRHGQKRGKGGSKTKGGFKKAEAAESGEGGDSAESPSSGPVEEAVPDATPKESKTALRSVVEELAARNESRAQLDAIEQRYFAKLKEHYKNQGSVERMAGELVNPDTIASFASKELRELRSEWFGARSQYARADQVLNSARLKARPNEAREALLQRLRERNMQGERKLDLLERYERRFTAPIVALDSERKELAVKREGLSERQNTAIDRALERYKKLPPGIRILSTSALMFSAGALAASTPVGLAALGVAGTSALMRWSAEVSQSRTLGAIARLTSVMGITGYIAEAAVRGGHSIMGTEARAREALDTREGFGNLADEKNLKRIANERRAALDVEGTIERQGRLARIFGSIAGGWLFGSIAHGGGTETASIDTEHASANSASAQDGGSEAARMQAPEREMVGAPASSSGPEAHAPMELPSAAIDTGEGFNALFEDLRGEAANPQAPVDRLLAEHTSSELSERIGAYDPETGKSMEMQVGDRLFKDPEGNLRFQHAGSETSQIVIDKDGGFHEIKNVKMIGGPASSEAVVEMDSSVSAPSSYEADETETVVADTISKAAEIPSLDAYMSGQGEVSPHQETSSPISSTSTGGPIPLDKFNAELEAREAASNIESFENAHGVEIIPSEPAAYQWKLPGSDSVYIVVSGATPDEQSDWAREYAKSHPNEAIRFITSERDPMTGVVTTRMDAWKSDNGAPPELLTNMTARASDGEQHTVSRVNVNDFIRKLS